MDTLRFVLVLSLAMVSFMLWEAWQRDYGPPARAAARPGDGAPATPPATDSGVPALPASPGGQAPGFDAPNPAETERELITVETDVLRLKIDSGGTLVFAELLNYPVSLEEGAKPIVLLDQSTSLFHVIQSGLIGTDAPSHEHQFSSPRKAYSLGENESALKVPLRWVSEQGVAVSKVFELERGSYRIRLRHQVENRSGANWEGRQYAQIKRDDPSRAGRMLLYTYTGAVLSGPEKRYDKISFDDMRDGPTKADIANGWAAMIQHYFLTAVIPSDQQATYHYYTQDFANGLYSIGHISPALRLAPGGQDELVGEVYVGPKLQADLAQLAEGLDLTVDYGWLWFLAKPLFWCLERLHGLTGNWGWSIILVTILLKLLFYHLSAAGYRSMANMRRVQPRLMALRDRYKDDRARMNQAMMQIYKEEKINPFGGCFPILVQIPVFIALYWVLLESVELRQADFILWLNDLSVKDPYFVLPVIMGVTMYIQQKLNPAPMDPLQEKVFKLLPLIFTVFFAFFPSGLVLYWVTNNILSIAQQWLIMRNLEKEGLGTAKDK